MRFKTAAICALSVCAAALASPALAGHPQLDRSRLDCGGGTKLVDVIFHVKNDVDYAFFGPWASSNYDKRVQMWEIAPDTFCGLVLYTGRVTSFGGTSPNLTGTIGPGVVANFYGGYVTTPFTGTFAPTVQTHGSLGTFDVACDPSGDCDYDVLPGWSSLFVPGHSPFDTAWFEFIYTTPRNGTWIQTPDASTGDITGSPPGNSH